MGNFKNFVGGFQSFGRSVNTLVSFFILLIVYFIGVGLTSIFGKIFRKRFLDLKKSTSYWIITNISPTVDDCEKSY